METLSPPSSADAPCLVFLMSLDSSHLRAGPKFIGPHGGRQMFSPIDSAVVDSNGRWWLRHLLVVSSLSLGDREWLR